MTDRERNEQDRLTEMIQSYRLLSSMVEQALLDGDLVSTYEAFKPLFIVICLLRQDRADLDGEEINVLEDFIKAYRRLSIIRNAQDDTVWN